MGLIKSVTCCMIGEYTPDHDSIATMLCTYMIKMVLERILGVPLSLDSGNTKDTKRAEFWTKISEISFQVMRRKWICKCVCNSCFSSHRYPES